MLPAHVETSKTHRQLKKKKKTKENKQTKKKNRQLKVALLSCVFSFIFWRYLTTKIYLEAPFHQHSSNVQ